MTEAHIFERVVRVKNASRITAASSIITAGDEENKEKLHIYSVEEFVSSR